MSSICDQQHLHLCNANVLDLQERVQIAGYTQANEQPALCCQPVAVLKACDDTLKLDTARMTLLGDAAEQLRLASSITGASFDGRVAHLCDSNAEVTTC